MGLFDKKTSPFLKNLGGAFDSVFNRDEVCCDQPSRTGIFGKNKTGIINFQSKESLANQDSLCCDEDDKSYSFFGDRRVPLYCVRIHQGISNTVEYTVGDRIYINIGGAEYWQDFFANQTLSVAQIVDVVNSILPTGYSVTATPTEGYYFDFKGPILGEAIQFTVKIFVLDMGIGTFGNC